MNRKKILSLVLGGVMLASMPLTFVGCELSENQNVVNPGITTPDVNKNPGGNVNPGNNDKPQDTKPDNKELEAAVSKLNAILDKAQENANFNLIENELGKETIYHFDGTDGYGYVDGEEHYYRVLNGEKVHYYVSDKDKSFHIEYTDSSLQDFALDVIEDLKTAKWDSFSDDKLSGTYKNKGAEAKVVGGGIFYKLNDGTKSVEVTDVNGVEIIFPAESDCVYDTAQTEDKSKDLYSEVNGQKVWNLPLLEKTIIDWFKETDFYTKNLSHNRFICSLDDIVYLSFNDEDSRYEFGAYATEDNRKIFQVFVIGSNFEKALNSGEIKTADDVSKWLTESVKKDSYNLPIDIGAAPITIESTVSQDDMKKMWGLVQNRLETVGVQRLGFGTDKDGVVTDKYKDAKFVGGFLKQWPQGVELIDGYFVKGTVATFFVEHNDGTQEKVDVNLIGESGVTSPYENIMQNKKWVIGKLYNTDIQLLDKANTKTIHATNTMRLNEGNIVVDDKQQLK